MRDVMGTPGEEVSKVLWKKIPLIVMAGLILLLSTWFPDNPVSVGLVAVFLVVLGIVVIAVIGSGGNPFEDLWSIIVATVKIIVVCTALLIGVGLVSGLLTELFLLFENRRS